MLRKIAAVINYCTNDYRFLRLCTQEALKCCSQVIVPVCDHFFNGEPENRELLERSYKENPDCRFVEQQLEAQSRPFRDELAELSIQAAEAQPSSLLSGESPSFRREFFNMPTTLNTPTGIVLSQRVITTGFTIGTALDDTLETS